MLFIIIITVSVTALVTYFITSHFLTRSFNLRLRAMNNLPTETLTWEDTKRQALELQGFLGSHLFAKGRFGQTVYLKSLSESIKDDQHEWLRPYTVSLHSLALVSLCRQLGIEIVLRDQNQTRVINPATVPDASPAGSQPSSDKPL